MSKKTMQVTLSFIADTKQAKKEVQNLAQQLSSLSTRQIQTSMLRDVSADAKQAAYDVGKFTSMLHGAINTNTGKLDLSKLNKSLKTANTDLSKVAQSFKALGSDGVRAFEGVVKQINAAEVPLKKTSTLVDHLWDSMKKTVTWQISSSALHGLMSGVSGAMRYAQELNKSLTDIQIVTQRNTDQMAKFAIEANKAAKALSTTTGRYAEASLIYFQQGLSDQQVKERTDVTVKMANVTRESAAEVSNQLTSIWNNFDNGSKSLEYYADVLTKLGATTASSTAEISGGLEKFAAIGNTIGLSYEYAASALATITSNTRQSEEVVGTALKTIFARIQGLNLGDTLDDGTTLNKYSQALEAVGISIFDQAGQIKTMDNILDEMSSKWGTMAKDQQIALAQTVAGVRQYTQLVALMDNWNSGDNDSMVANLNTAYNASGALSEQADIYARSWEAAQNRVRASWEELYDTLISDDFFIDLLDAGAKVLDIIDQMIKGFGGVSGLLSVISTYFINLSKTKITEELIRLTGPSNKTRQEEAKTIKKQANNELTSMANSLTSGHELKTQASIANNIGALQNKLIDNNEKISDSQRKVIEDLLQQYRLIGDIVAKKGASLDETEKEAESFEKQIKLLDKINTREAQSKKEQAQKDLTEKNRQAQEVFNHQTEGLEQELIGHTYTNKYNQVLKDEVNWASNLLAERGLAELSTEEKQSLYKTKKDDDREKVLKQILLARKPQEETFDESQFGEPVLFSQTIADYRKRAQSIGDVQTKLYASKQTEIFAGLQEMLGGEEGEDGKTVYKNKELYDKLEAAFADNRADGDTRSFQDVIAGLKDIKEGQERVENEDFLAVVEATESALLTEQVNTRSALMGMGMDETQLNNFDAYSEKLTEIYLKTGDLEKAKAELKGHLDNINQTLDEAQDPLKTWQSDLVSAVGAVTSLVTAFKALGGVWDTLQNPDLTPWEKISTVFGTIITILPGVISAWKALSTEQLKNTVVTLLNTAASWANAEAKDKMGDETREAANEQARETGTKVVDNVVNGVTKKTSKLQSNTGGLTKGFNLLGKATKGVLSKFGGLIAGAATAAAVIASLVWWMSELDKAYNKNESAAQKAEESANNLTQAYTESKAKYDELVGTISSYESAQSGLENLTHGTLEFKEAISKANDEALKLMDNYGHIIGDRYSVNSDGLIEIDKDALEHAKEQQFKETQQKQVASIVAKQQAREARSKANITKANREVIKTQEGFTKDDLNRTGYEAAAVGAVGAGVGFAAGAKIGGVIGSFIPVPVIGTLIGTVAGAAVGAVAGNIVNSMRENSETEKEQSVLNLLASQYRYNGEEALTKENIEKLYNEDLTNEEIDAIRKLCKELYNNTIATEAENKTIATQILNEAGYKVEGNEAAAGALFDALIKDAKKDYENLDMANFWGVGTEAGKEAWARYAEAQGLNNLKDYKVDNYRKDGGVTYTYKDDQGEKQKVTITAEQITATLSSIDATNKLTEAMQSLEKRIDEAKNSTNMGDNAFGDFLADRNFNNSSQSEVADLKNDIIAAAKAGGIKDPDALSPEAIGWYLDKYAGDGKDGKISSSTALGLGFSSYEKAVNDIAAALNAEYKDLGDNFKDFTEIFNYGTNRRVYDDKAKMEDDGVAYSNLLKFIAGQEGYKNLSGEDKENLMSKFTNLDWFEYNIDKDAVALLREYGIVIDKTSEDWKNHVRTMRDVTNATVDFEKLYTTIKNIESITKDIKLGDILEKDKYETLVKYNDELARYFRILADGTAQFVGDPLDFQQEQREDKIASLKEAINASGKSFSNLNSQYQEAFKNREQANAIQEMSDADLFQYLKSKNIETTGLKKEYQDLQNRETLFSVKDWDTFGKTFGQTLKKDSYAQLERDQSSVRAELENLAINPLSPLSDEEFQKLEKQYSTLLTAQTELATSVDAKERQKLLDEGYISQDVSDYAGQIDHNKEKWEGFETQEVEDYSKVIKEMVGSSALLDETLKKNPEAMEDVALYTMKMNRGIKTLADNWDDWNSILLESDKGSHEYAEAILGLKGALSDVLGVSEDWISSDFFKGENLTLLEQAAEGSAEAITKLQIAMANDVFNQLDFSSEDIKSKAQKAHEALMEFIQNQDNTIKVGAEIKFDGTEDAGGIEEKFAKKAAAIIETAQMTAEEATAYFRSIGYEPKFETETKYVKQKNPIIATTSNVVNEGPEVETVVGFNSDGTPQMGTKQLPVTIQTSKTIGYTEADTAIQIPILTTKGEDGKVSGVDSGFSLTKTTSGAMNNFSSVNAGGKTSSGSKPKKAKRPKKSDVVERYKEINDKLKETSDLMETNNKLADSLWGDERFGKLEEEIDLLKQENEQLEERLEWSKAYLAEDKKALSEATAKAGINFTFDKDGYITNYTTEMTKLYKQLDNATVAANASGGVSDVEQDRIDKIQEKIDAVEDARKAYDGTLDEINSDTQKHLDNQLKIWEKHFDLLNEKLELEVDINDTQLEEIEYYLDKISDKIYEAVDGYELLSQQFAEQEENYQAQKTYLENLNSAYKNGEIGLTQYKEGLKESQGAILDNLSALEDLKTTMQEYYGDILSMAQEETATFTDQMEHLSSVLDHYSSLMDVLGKEQDYDMKDSLLRGQADTVKNDLEVAKQLYQLYSAEADEWRTKMLAAVDGSIEQENYRKNWEAAQEAANEAQENMLSKTEAWAEAMKAVVENELKSLARTLEESLTGGSNFDTLLQDMDRASNLQEEYLTATNQIYETNKLMRQAQQEIDKSTNTVAKKRLAGFIEETQQLQDQSQLSQYELEIQQAKYDLLLAEIALEESQNAKSMVRLQRDNEGNFGYVYTADSGAVAQAEQELIDKQNNLYNIALRGSNDYSQKYMDTLSEMYDTLTDLQTQYLDGAFKDEQAYQDAVTSAKEYYYDKLKQYSSLHQVALTTDSRVIADAWSNDFNDMITKTDEWKDCVDTFADDAAQSLQGWADTVAGLLDESGFNDIDDTVKDIVDNHTDYRDILIGEGGVVDALTSEIEKANELAEANIGVQDSIAGIIAEYEKLLKLVTGEYADKTLQNNYLKIPEVDVESIINNVKSNSTNASAESSGSYSSKGTSTGGSSGSASKNSASTSQANQKLKNSAEQMGQALKNKATDFITKLINGMGFASGGYTGAWGPDGKWAVLHEKELILNKHDTENFLASMEVLQRILQIIDLQSASSQLGGILSTPKFGYNNQGTLEQNVHIEANFPNATNHNEIEEAFGNLVNLASQYANRK